MNRRAIPIILMLIGAALFIGVLLFVVEEATSPEPVGLATIFLTLLGLLLSAASGIRGWLDFNKKEPQTNTKTITTGDNNQIIGGNGTINIKQGDKSLYIKHYHAASDGDPAAPFLNQLRPAPADFKGREALITQLLEDFHSHKGATISGKSLHGLTGMGGVGKTALGLVVAHKIANDYPDAQIFLDLKGTTEPLSAVEIMRHVILSLEPTRDLRALDEKGMADVYYSVLHDKKVLLFFDNARSAEQIVQPPSTCALLVTSRWTFPVTGLKNHPLDVMKEEDAIALLLELCPRIGEHAAGLAKACGYLPLALRIAGSFLSINKNSPVKEYLQELNDSKTRLTALKQSHKDAELKSDPELLAAFELSYNQLQEQEQKNWRMLGVFPTSFAMSAAKVMWELEENETRKLLSLFCRYSLLDYDETTARYSLHDLLAEYAGSLMNPEEEYAARLKHAGHYKDLLAAADDLYLEGGENILLGLRLFDLEWDNIRAGQTWVTSVPQIDSAIAQLCIAYPDAGVYVLGLRQHPREGIQWLKAALSAARELGHRSGEAAALANLGSTYLELGDARKAIKYHEQTLVIKREIGDRRGEGNSLGNLGLAYADLGDARKAIEYYEQQLVIAREIGDRRGEGAVLGNLGTAYADLGDAHKAIEYHEQSLVIHRDIGNRRGEGNALGSLGLAYRDLGETRQAIEYLEQALVIHRDIGNRRGEGTALGNLGIAYRDLGETRQAIEYYGQALVIKREIGDRHGEADSNWNLGLEYEKAGELEKAIDAMQICVDFEREIGHPDAEKDAARVEKIRKKLAEQNPPT